MTASVKREGNRFSISAEDYGKAKLAISLDELITIHKDLNIWFNESEQELSERKQLLSRMSYLEGWKKHKISTDQRTAATLGQWQTEVADYSAELTRRIVSLELGRSDWNDAIYTSLRHRVELLEENRISDGRKISLESRMTTLENYVKGFYTPAGSTKDKAVIAIEKHIEDINRYLAGEIDNVVVYANKIAARVTELERLDGLHQLFVGQQNTRIGLVETVTDKFRVSLAEIREALRNIVTEQTKLGLDTKHLNGRLRTVETKPVSLEIKAEKTPPPGSLAEAMINNANQKNKKENERTRNKKFNELLTAAVNRVRTAEEEQRKKTGGSGDNAETTINTATQTNKKSKKPRDGTGRFKAKE